MCLNRARLRRRLRKTLGDDWRHLYTHALNADDSPELQAALAAGGWRWKPLQPDGGYDPQVRMGGHHHWYSSPRAHLAHRP